MRPVPLLRNHAQITLAAAHLLEDAGSALLERDGQVAELESALAGVASTGRGGMAFVAGEAGVGKTQLLRRFCDRARRARVLWAGCDPLSAPRPLGPLFDVCEQVGDECAAAISSGAQPHALAAALRHEFEGPAPMVFVLEDAHWADEATLDVVRLLARRIEALSALVIVSYRDEQVPRQHPLRLLLGELPTHTAITRMELAPLSRAGVAELAARFVADVDELYERTAGNPFFVTEVLAGRSEHLPATVRDAVLARAARVSEVGQQLLDAASVVPQRADLWLLEAMGVLVGSALEDCLTSGMLRAEGPGVTFRHELARQAIEESVLPDRAVVLHAAALAALTDPPGGAPDLARLAHHAEAAADIASVLRFAPAAAERASALGAHREAEAQYARALRHAHSAPPEVRVQLLEGFAGEAFLTDMRNEATDALTEAADIHRARGDARGLARVLQFRARILACFGRGAEARADLEHAVAALEAERPGVELAQVYAELAGGSMRSDDYAGTMDWGTRGAALAEELDDAATLARSLNCMAVVETTRGEASGREKFDRSIAIARGADEAVEAGNAYINAAGAFTAICDWRAADAYIEPGIEYCRERGLEAWEAALLAGRAEVSLAFGAWDEVDEITADLLSRPRDQALPRFDALILLGLAHVRRGVGDYWPAFDESLELARVSGDLQMVGPAACARCEALWLEGRPDGIDGETQAAFDLALEMQAPWDACKLALWRLRAGLDAAVPGALLVGPFEAQLAGLHREAADDWRARGSNYVAALALLDAGDEASLREAHGELRALAAGPALAIAARRLRSVGARGLPRGPRASTRANQAGLTAREFEVLELLVQGLANAQIASRLVLSERTVHHHVSAILRKLDVPSRGQAAALAVRSGLIAET